MKTAVQLGYTGDRLEHIRLGGELHDIGKIGTREDILNKPGPLTPTSSSTSRGTPRWGSGSWRPSSAESPIVLADRALPPRAAGRRGFPDCLTGDGIPAEARIVAVVDAFDAMTTNRAYRPSRTPADAVEELRRCAGAHFDPRWWRRSCGPSRRSAPPSPSDRCAGTGLDVRHPDDQRLRNAGTCGNRSYPRARGPARGRVRRLGPFGHPWPPVHGRRPAVVLGRDARTSGPMFTRAAAAGLMSVGVDVIELGVVPTPTVQMAVEHHHAGGGLILTASHNPIEWNALKFVGPDGIFLDADAGRRVRELAEQGPPRMGWKGLGEVRDDGEADCPSPGRDPRPASDRCHRHSPAGFHVALDCVRGAGAIAMLRCSSGWAAGCPASISSPTGASPRARTRTGESRRPGPACPRDRGRDRPGGRSGRGPAGPRG